MLLFILNWFIYGLMCVCVCVQWFFFGWSPFHVLSIWLKTHRLFDWQLIVKLTAIVNNVPSFAPFYVNELNRCVVVFLYFFFFSNFRLPTKQANQPSVTIDREKRKMHNTLISLFSNNFVSYFNSQHAFHPNNAKYTATEHLWEVINLEKERKKRVHDAIHFGK